ncbi:MAG: S1C family serine protease [Terriglobia bacterium]
MRWLICVVFSFFLVSIALAVQKPSTALDQSKSLSDMIDLVRPSVVRIQVDLANSRTEVPGDLPFRGCFRSGTCVVGTGLFVNENGDVVTAWHVANDVAAIVQTLEQRGIQSAVLVSLALPNVEKENGKIKVDVARNFAAFPYGPLAMDRAHDLCVISPARLNPFQGIPQISVVLPPENVVPKLKPIAARMFNARPRDGDEVFACGFPLGDEALDTTTGHIATAWGEDYLAAAQNGYSEKSEVYKLDLRVNLGNSGGPVFRNTDQSVIGIVHGISPGVSGEGTAIIVPSHYIIELLNKNGRSWRSSTSIGHN